MVEWLGNLPNLAIILLGSGSAIVLVLATGLWGRRRPPDSAGSKAALEGYKIIVTFTAIMLSFSLVQAQAIFTAADAAASREAGSLNQLDRVLVRYQTPAADAIRPLLQAYVAAVLKFDWPALHGGKGSVEGQTALRALNQAVQTLDGGRAVKPELFADMLRQLEGINDARQGRIDGSALALPSAFWEAIGVLCLVLLVLSAQIQTEARLIAIGGHAISVAVLMALVFIVDQPYRGETSVSPAPIKRVLAAILTRSH